jgi:hypothetical protein
MATTTNYGWGTPDDTDLVKDGALAIRDLGQDIDTTTKALNPETTTGDIAYRSATANTNTRLALGTAGQVLTVNSGATAPEWATPSGGGATFAGCSLSKSANQSIANNTFTALTFDVEQFDTDTFHSTSTNTSRITIPAGKSGYYQVNASVAWATNTSGLRYLAIYKNGVDYFRIDTAVSDTDGRIHMGGNIIMNLVETDYIEIYVFQSTGGNLNVSFDSAGPLCTNFNVGFLGA